MFRIRARGLEFKKVGDVFALVQLIGPDPSSVPSSCAISPASYKSAKNQCICDSKNFGVASHSTKCLRLLPKLRVLQVSESLPDSLESNRHSGATDMGMIPGVPAVEYPVFGFR